MSLLVLSDALQRSKLLGLFVFDDLSPSSVKRLLRCVLWALLPLAGILSLEGRVPRGRDTFGFLGLDVPTSSLGLRLSETDNGRRGFRCSIDVVSPLIKDSFAAASDLLLWLDFNVGMFGCSSAPVKVFVAYQNPV